MSKTIEYQTFTRIYDVHVCSCCFFKVLFVHVSDKTINNFIYNVQWHYKIHHINTTRTNTNTVNILVYVKQLMSATTTTRYKAHIRPKQLI